MVNVWISNFFKDFWTGMINSKVLNRILEYTIAYPCDDVETEQRILDARYLIFQFSHIGSLIIHFSHISPFFRLSFLLFHKSQFLIISFYCRWSENQQLNQLVSNTCKKIFLLENKSRTHNSKTSEIDLESVLLHNCFQAH